MYAARDESMTTSRGARQRRSNAVIAHAGASSSRERVALSTESSENDGMLSFREYAPSQSSSAENPSRWSTAARVRAAAHVPRSSQNRGLAAAKPDGA